MSKIKRLRVAALLLGLGIIGAGRADAVFVVVPNANASIEGALAFTTAPFNNTSRLQQVYGASEFGSTPILISQITFRPDSSQGAFSHFLSDLKIDMSTTSASSSNLSSTFANNVGSNDTTVFNAPITLSSSSTAGPGNTKAFDIIINLTTPFLYNPVAGNLLLDITNFGTGFTGFVDAAFDPNLSLVFVNNSTTSASGTVQSGVGGVTQFTFQAVPEPSSLALCGIAGTIGIVVARVSRKRSP